MAEGAEDPLRLAVTQLQESAEGTMDLSDILAGENADVKVKEAEALQILGEHAMPAMKSLEMLKRQFGEVVPRRQLGNLVDPTEGLLYEKGKKDATKILFDTYADIALRQIRDPEAFIDLLGAIQEKVAAKLTFPSSESAQPEVPLIDRHEAELCRLAWERTAWERAKPTAIQATWRRFKGWWRRNWLDSTDRRPQERDSRNRTGRNAADADGPADLNASSDSIQRVPTQKALDPADVEQQHEPALGGAAAAAVPATSTLQPGGEALGMEAKPQFRPKRWEDIDFFIDDHEIEIRIAGKIATCSYVAFGFQDKRTGNPDQQWAVLQVFAQLPGGIMPDDARHGSEWLAIAKRVERVRKILQRRFGLTDDPIPYEKGRGYSARFKICRVPDHSSNSG